MSDFVHRESGTLINGLIADGTATARPRLSRSLGDFDGALSDVNEAIRLNPALPSPLINRAVIWRAKADIDRAISDAAEAIRLAKAKAPVNVRRRRAAS